MRWVNTSLCVCRFFLLWVFGFPANFGNKEQNEVSESNSRLCAGLRYVYVLKRFRLSPARPSGDRVSEDGGLDAPVRRM